MHDTDASRPTDGASLLLSGLTADYGQHFRSLCDRVAMSFGQVLTEADEPIAHVYFPISGFLSLIVPADAEHTLEVGLIGVEGMLGATLILEVPYSPLRAMVQGDGFALRMGEELFCKELRSSPQLHELVGKCCYVQLRMCAQAAACAHYHSVRGRLARWLLMTLDRTEGQELQLTQEFLSRMLGVRRVGITEAAGDLKADHLISYQHGTISVLDREGLESQACACYDIDRRNYVRVLG